VTEHVPNAVWAGEFSRLKAPLGVWAILGNHDWWFDLEGVRRALAKVGIPVLENRAVMIGEGSRRFWLAGLADQLAYPLGNGRFRGEDDLAGTLAQVTTEHPVILLAHEPDIFPNARAGIADAVRSYPWRSDPHSPDLAEPGAVPLRSTVCLWPHRGAGRHMIISGGLGTSFVPVRIGVPPEIVHIEIGA